MTSCLPEVDADRSCRYRQATKRRNPVGRPAGYRCRRKYGVGHSRRQLMRIANETPYLAIDNETPYLAIAGGLAVQ